MGIFGVLWYKFKLLPCNNTQKVNKQTICSKNLGFVLGVRMS